MDLRGNGVEEYMGEVGRKKEKRENNVLAF